MRVAERWSPHSAWTPHVSQPGELLFEFLRERDHVRFRCELRDHGAYGVEAQYLRNEEFLIGRRFDTRELAILWAEYQRTAILRGLGVL